MNEAYWSDSVGSFQSPGTVTHHHVDPSNALPSAPIEASGPPISSTSLDDATLSTFNTEDGMQTLIHIPSADSPMTYDFQVNTSPDTSLKLHEDGSASLESQTGTVVALYKIPWAIDAAGQSVQTPFEIEGNIPRQRILPTENTQYPILADPQGGVWGRTVCVAAVGVHLVPWGASARIAYKLIRKFGSIQRAIQIIWRAYHAKHGKAAQWHAATAASFGLFGEIMGINQIKNSCFS